MAIHKHYTLVSAPKRLSWGDQKVDLWLGRKISASLDWSQELKMGRA